MQIFVRTGRTLTLQVGASATVADVKAIVEAREGLPVEEQRLVFAGRQLADDCSLAHCGVEEEATLSVLGRLLGGAKKRKKKTYTKPKKIKHKHKKIKLRVLQFYKVDDSGKVTRLKRECPNCGPGIFMANHFDRNYCGKCGHTMALDKQPEAQGKAAKGGKGKGKGKA